MAISVMSTPLYVSALWAAIRNRSTGFAVTRKGAVSGDRVSSFTRHLAWAAVLLAALAASQLLGHTHAAIRVWAVLSLVMSLLPVVIWLAGSARRQPVPEPTPSPAVVRTVRPRTPAVTFVGNRAADVPQPQESTR
jgi:Na+-transporting methylmalonyl-CoA/oxaloacetate decarboxylase gamma subunit